MSIPPLYATLPVGTRVQVNTGWISPHDCGGTLYREGTVVRDEGDQVVLLIDVDGYGNVASFEHTFYKSRITRVIAGPKRSS